jgi:hypothetical protein
LLISLFLLAYGAHMGDNSFDIHLLYIHLELTKFLINYVSSHS